MRSLDWGASVNIIKNAVPEEEQILKYLSINSFNKVSVCTKPLKFLICANPHPYKNIQFTIDALRKFSIDWRLDVVGDLNSDFARKLASNNIAHNICFHGALHGTKKFDIIELSENLFLIKKI